LAESDLFSEGFEALYFFIGLPKGLVASAIHDKIRKWNTGLYPQRCRAVKDVQDVVAHTCIAELV